MFWTFLKLENYLNTGTAQKNPFFQGLNFGSLYSPQVQGKMNAAAFMSGSGSNFEEMYGLEKRLGNNAPYKIKVVVTDTTKGYINAGKIIQRVTGNQDTIPRIFLKPSVIIDERFKGKDNPLKERGRTQYDMAVIEELDSHNVNFGILAGYMRLLSTDFITRLGFNNVHPSPLNVINKFTGEREFTGDNAVRDQILAGRNYLQSTVNVARAGADTGEILMISNKSNIDLGGYSLDDLRNNDDLLNKIISSNQDRLKKIGDLDIFPKSMILTALGKYKFNPNGKLMFNDVVKFKNSSEMKMDEFNRALKHLSIRV